MHNLNISNLNCTAPKDFLRQFNVNTIVTKIEETNNNNNNNNNYNNNNNNNNQNHNHNHNHNNNNHNHELKLIKFERVH